MISFVFMVVILLIEELATLEKLATMWPMKQGLNQAIEVAGGISAFTQAINAPSVNAVKAWRLTRIPADYCPVIEKVTGVPCESLRPDVEWSVLRKTKRQAKPTKEAAHG